jgi:hypothetical protein
MPLTLNQYGQYPKINQRKKKKKKKEWLRESINLVEGSMHHAVYTRDT